MKLVNVNSIRKDNGMRDITLCHPRLQELAARLTDECSKQGLIIKIGETLRTIEEQNELYAQGRTKPGNIVTNAPGTSYSSYHQWGTAFDFFRNDGQGAYNESGDFFGRVGTIGVSIGLEWGGNWKSPVDKPHFQLPDWGSSTSGIKKIYANPEAFTKTWGPEKKVGWITDAIGTWFRRTDGTWPANEWCIKNNRYYLFNRDGYMMTGWHRWDADTKVCDPDDGSGKWYFFDNTKGGDYEGACWKTDDSWAQGIGIVDLPDNIDR